MDQFERFATACLGFALHHDVVFRKEFLRQVCDYDGPLSAEQFEVELEITGCGDLALTATDTRFVVEVKIKAGLQGKQNPDSKEFWKAGYGHGILSSPHRERAYVVLWQEKDKLFNKHSRKLRCSAKSWHALTNIPATKQSIVFDLFNSLGSFNIRAFAIRNPMTDNLKLASQAKYACQIHDVLKDVAAYLKECLGLPCIEDSSISRIDDGGYIGWDLLTRKANSKWTKFISPVEKKIGWFGYEGGVLNVGFYCAPKKAEAIRDTLKKIMAKYGDVHNYEGYVAIESKNDNQGLGDKEWFKTVYDLVGAHIKLH